MNDQIQDQSISVAITATEKVFPGRVWDLRRETFEYNGESIVRDYVDHTGAVAVLAMDEQGQVMLIQQYRHPIGSRVWEIPAGLLDVPGEPPLAAAKRELAEEGDIAATEWAVLLDIFPSPGGSDEAVRIYLARGIHEIAEPYPRVAEEADIVTRWLPLDDVVDAALQRRIGNAPLVSAVLAAKALQARNWVGLGDPELPWPYRGRGELRA